MIFLGLLRSSPRKNRPARDRSRPGALTPSQSAKKLASLFGFTNQSDEQGTARLTLNAEGHMADGLQTMAELQALGAAAKYSGRLHDDGRGRALSRAEGHLALEAADGASLRR